MAPKILISYPLSPARIEALNSPYAVKCVSGKKSMYEEVCEKISDFDALLCMGHQADKKLMDLGNKLKVISNYGVGYDNVDVAYAKEKGIMVSNLPRSTSAPTANMAIGLMLSLMLKISLHDRLLREEKLPKWDSPASYGSSPGGKLMGIIGMGRIGKEMAKRARALDMEICYYKRNRMSADEEQKHGAIYLELDDLLRQSDVVSLHTPLTESTFHLIGKREIDLMKSTAFLLNTARGSVVDNDALIKALQGNKIAGAGLDVFPNEPEVPKAYLSMDHVVLTPHAGTATHESRMDMFNEAFQNAVDLLDDKEIDARVV
ncbi:MAG: NAD(P)-dependent oxidoreductase [Bacteroidia bacterium]|nr:NAD(P)-dependent oxidoreductase [Bacteroidia bacterium]